MDEQGVHMPRKASYNPFQNSIMILPQVHLRVARRFMPRLKTESEVATMRYLRERTNIPVPTVYHYDANPYNRLGGEYILMSKVCCVVPLRLRGSYRRG